MSFFTQTEHNTKTPLPIYPNITNINTLHHNTSVCIWKGFTYTVLSNNFSVKLGSAPIVPIATKININPLTNNDLWHLVLHNHHHLDTAAVAESAYTNTMQLITALADMKDFAYSIADGVDVYLLNASDINYNATEIDGTLIYFALTKTCPMLLTTFPLTTNDRTYYISYLPSVVPDRTVRDALSLLLRGKL